MRWHRIVWKPACRLVGATWIGLAAMPAFAHHGFSGRYDYSRPLLVEGTIAEWRSDRVHVEFSFLVTDHDDVAARHDFGALEAIEGRPLRPRSVRPGDRPH